MPNPYSLSPVKPQEPGRLFVLAFADELTAFELRETLCQMEEEGMIEVGDAVVATRNEKGKVRLHQSLPLVAAGTALGSFSGMLLGMLLLNPLFGSIAGAAAAATFVDAGIDDAFMKSLGETLTPGTSALFVIVRKSKPEQVIERLERFKPFAGRCKILQCNMPAENEALLRNLLEGEASRLQTTATTTTESKP